MAVDDSEIDPETLRARISFFRNFETFVEKHGADLRGDGVLLSTAIRELALEDSEFLLFGWKPRTAFPVVPLVARNVAYRKTNPVPRKAGTSAKDPSPELLAQCEYYVGLVAAFFSFLSDGVMKVCGDAPDGKLGVEVHKSYWSIPKYAFATTTNELYGLERGKRAVKFEALRVTMPTLMPIDPAELSGMPLNEAFWKFVLRDGEVQYLGQLAKAMPDNRYPIGGALCGLYWTLVEENEFWWPLGFGLNFDGSPADIDSHVSTKFMASLARKLNRFLEPLRTEKVVARGVIEAGSPVDIPRSIWSSESTRIHSGEPWVGEMTDELESKVSIVRKWNGVTLQAAAPMAVLEVEKEEEAPHRRHGPPDTLETHPDEMARVLSDLISMTRSGGGLKPKLARAVIAEADKEGVRFSRSTAQRILEMPLKDILIRLDKSRPS